MSVKCETKQISHETGSLWWWDATLVKIIEFRWTRWIMTRWRISKSMRGRGAHRKTYTQVCTKLIEKCLFVHASISQPPLLGCPDVFLRILPSNGLNTIPLQLIQSLQPLVSSPTSLLNGGQSTGNNYFLLSGSIIYVWIKYTLVLQVRKPQTTFPEEHQHTVTNSMSLESNAVISIHMRLPVYMHCAECRISHLMIYKKTHSIQKLA